MKYYLSVCRDDDDSDDSLPFSLLPLPLLSFRGRKPVNGGSV